MWDAAVNKPITCGFYISICCFVSDFRSLSSSEMTYIVSGGALNSTHSSFGYMISASEMTVILEL